MKTLDSLIERFENAVAQHGVECVAPPQIVAAWESETEASVASDTIMELLRVWLEYCFAANKPVTPKEAAALFPDVSFSASQLQSLEFEYRRLLSAESSAERSRQTCSATMADLPEVGETWDGFLLLEVLGEGAFARVYLARQLAMAGRLVALKLTYRATQESQLLARLHHSAIVPIYSMHNQNEIYGLCMPYLGNTTLMDLLKEILPAGTENIGSVDHADGAELLGILVHRQEKITTVVNYSPEQDTQQLDSDLTHADGSNAESAAGNDLRSDEHSARDDGQAASRQSDSDAGRQNRISTAIELSKLNYVGVITWIGAQLADALEHAHRHGVLHCDIKPANVLLAPDGQARLLDFNVSLEKLNSTTETRVGGTLAYMAPEHLAAVQGMGKAQIDARSDIYSLGIVLFEMLAGVVPKQHANDDHIPVRQLLQKANPAVTPALAAIISKCLAKRADQRYSSADQLYDDLNAQCNSLPLVHQIEPSLIERTNKWVRRHPLLTSVSSISLLAACLLVISLLGFLWRGSQLEQLERARRGDRVQQLVPEAIALVSATRNYPELASEARLKTGAIFSLLRNKSDEIMDLSVVKDRAQLQTLVRLSKSNELELKAQELDSERSADFATDKFSASLAQLDAALGENNSDDSLHDELFEAYLGGRFSEVCEFGERLTDSRLNDYATWMFLGQSNLKVSDFPAARECFSVCITLRPTIEVAWFYRGIARLKSKQYEAAISDFSKAISLQAGFPAARYNMALAYDSLGELQPALDSLNHAIAGGWQSVSGFAFRSNLHKQLGNKTEAEQDLANALSCVPTTELDWVRRGTMRLATDPLGAKHDFERAVELNPSSIAGRQNLAHVLAEQLSQPEESLIHLNTLVELDATNAERWAGRGVVLARLGRLKDALRDLSHASAMKMTNPLVAYQIACGYSLVASQIVVEDSEAHQNAKEQQAESQEASGVAVSGLPSNSQITAAAMKWYKFSLQLRPDVAQIAMTDPDVAWLRGQPEFIEFVQSVRSRSND